MVVKDPPLLNAVAGTKYNDPKLNLAAGFLLKVLLLNSKLIPINGIEGVWLAIDNKGY